MAQVISLLCDRCLENDDQQVEAEESMVISISAVNPGVLRVIDLCPRCKEELLSETRQLLRARGRSYDGTEEGEEEGYDCPLCDFVGKNHRGVAMHVSRMHGQSLKDLEGTEPSPEPEFECSICHRKFLTRQGVSMHKIRKHRES